MIVSAVFISASCRFHFCLNKLRDHHTKPVFIAKCIYGESVHTCIHQCLPVQTHLNTNLHILRSIPSVLRWGLPPRIKLGNHSKQKLGTCPVSLPSWKVLVCAFSPCSPWKVLVCSINFKFWQLAACMSLLQLEDVYYLCKVCCGTTHYHPKWGARVPCQWTTDYHIELSKLSRWRGRWGKSLPNLALVRLLALLPRGSVGIFAGILYTFYAFLGIHVSLLPI